ncbi:MAG: OmpA/MotB domain protein [Fibrobacteres bacterium]|nr:OmpA/MotB domain protein [Fibrobacterota bacterium]
MMSGKPKSSFTMAMTAAAFMAASLISLAEAQQTRPARKFVVVDPPADTRSKDTVVVKGQVQARPAAQAAAPRTAAQPGTPRQTNITVQNGDQAPKARQDSLAQALAEKARRDSLAMAQKAGQDSAANAARARQDSLALADADRRLQEERSKRSEMENQLLTTGLLVLDAVYFETGKTDISINSKPYLDMLAKMLTKYPKLQIEVGGHTDNVGSDAYNRNLSQGRSAAVMAYMVGKAPELAGRLTAKGYGESAPKADNATAEGRKYNRRTELQVLNKDALKEYNEPARASGTAPAPTGHAAGSSTD